VLAALLKVFTKFLLPNNHLTLNLIWNYLFFFQSAFVTLATGYITINSDDNFLSFSPVTFASQYYVLCSEVAAAHQALSRPMSLDITELSLFPAPGTFIRITSTCLIIHITMNYSNYYFNYSYSLLLFLYNNNNIIIIIIKIIIIMIIIIIIIFIIIYSYSLFIIVVINYFYCCY
jgi:hypothetical protein